MGWFTNLKSERIDVEFQHPVNIEGFSKMFADGVHKLLVQQLVDIWLNDPEITSVNDKGEILNHTELKEKLDKYQESQ